MLTRVAAKFSHRLPKLFVVHQRIYPGQGLVEVPADRLEGNRIQPVHQIGGGVMTSSALSPSTGTT